MSRGRHILLPACLAQLGWLLGAAAPTSCVSLQAALDKLPLEEFSQPAKLFLDLAQLLDPAARLAG